MGVQRDEGAVEDEHLETEVDQRTELGPRAAAVYHEPPRCADGVGQRGDQGRELRMLGSEPRREAACATGDPQDRKHSGQSERGGKQRQQEIAFAGENAGR